MEEKIMFICKEKGKKSKNEVDRKLFKNLMEANLECIEIDKDRNEQRDVPFIVCKFQDNTEEMVEVKNCHEIMWSILNKYISK